MPRALVTGGSGFVGPYLIRHLLELGYEVAGGVHGFETALPHACRQIHLDVTHGEDVSRALAEMQPEEVYHLAGVTHAAYDATDEYYRVNFGGALNLLEAVREHAPEAGVLLVGSAYVYGRVDRPVTETEVLKPVNHYAVSKASADLLGYSYAVAGLRVVRTRPFNHSGPGQSTDFVLPSLVEQIAEVVEGKREPFIQLGNLDSVRDFSDVRDIVRGYRLALEKGRSGEVYNLGSARGVSVQDLFETVSREAGVEVELRNDTSRTRKNDVPYLVADVRKARRELGWEPKIGLDQTVRDMLNAVRNTVQR